MRSRNRALCGGTGRPSAGNSRRSRKNPVNRKPASTAGPSVGASASIRNPGNGKRRSAYGAPACDETARPLRGLTQVNLSVAPVAAHSERSRPYPSSDIKATSHRTVRAAQSLFSAKASTSRSKPSNKSGCGSRSGRAASASAQTEARHAKRVRSPSSAATRASRISPLNCPRCSSSRPRHVISRWFPGCHTPRAALPLAPRTNPLWRPCARVST